MPVTMANAGQTVIINRIMGTDDVRQHLAELGFVVGEKITVVSNNGGNVILQVKDARIALDKKMATRVIVA
ncbi:MAG: ferrous iron transport protein A [Lachnospiraceae bacterium]|nr:ferrous iron transport protein A [Lachnospiraceae bacterium]